VLKEARRFRSTEKGAKAEVNWNLFIAKHSDAYHLTAAGQAQIVGATISSTAASMAATIGMNPTACATC
jgi:hypothetical protein